MNKVTGARFPTTMGARSCTSTLQFKETPQHGIMCVDTPGFHSSTDIAQHMAAQKIALEGTALSGIYLVVKHARADDISQMLGDIMDFLGDDIRIIVTHEDVAQQGFGYDREELKMLLSERLGVPTHHITTVGRDTEACEIENFIYRTMHAPRIYIVGEKQLGTLASLCIGPRMVEKRTQGVYARIQAASVACLDLVQNGKSYGTDFAISVIQHDTIDMIANDKTELFRWALEELSSEQQLIVYGKAGLKLSLRVKEFIDTTNRFLTYDVTSRNDPHNTYRKCPFCQEIFIKTEGCDGQTTCGNVPCESDIQLANRRAINTSFVPEGNGWIMQFFVDGSQVPMDSLRSILRVGFQPTKTTRGTVLKGRGCGSTVTWSQMAPLSPDDLRALGFAETLREDSLETVSKARFQESVRQHEDVQRQALADSLWNTASR